MKAQIILNPFANSWGAQNHADAIRRAFDRANIAYDMLVTTRPHQATEVAHAASLNGVDMIVAAGGDGTINEVLNGMVRDDNLPTKPLGIIPIGTGNDFSDMQGLNIGIEAMVQSFKQGNTRQIDVGRLTTSTISAVSATSATHHHYFDNNCALAMEPMIALTNQRNKRFKGRLGYIYAVLKALLNLQAWEMEVVWDGGRYDGRVLLFSVCNGPRTGSTFMMYPAAKVDDGILDVVMIPEVPMRTVLNILPRLLNGTHLRHPAVRSFQAREITIKSSPGTPIHADGEIIAEAAEHIHYQLLPGKLTLMTV